MIDRQCTKKKNKIHGSINKRNVSHKNVLNSQIRIQLQLYSHQISMYFCMVTFYSVGPFLISDPVAIL